MSDNLPPEILTDILVRLPVGSLVRCTCVCKSWYSLLTNPTFVTSHLNRNRTIAIAQNENRLLVRHYSEKSEKEHYTLHLDNEKLDEYAKLDFPFKSAERYFRIIGSFNGLVCLSDDEGCYTNIMILWNPSIKKFVNLPRPKFTFTSHGPFQHSVGFGFHSATNDYKIVRVVYLQGDIYDKVPPKVELYELSTGCWRRINARNFPYVIEQRATQAFLNGVVHWVGSNFNRVGGNFFNLVVSFDMDHEVFGAMMVPESVADQRWPRSMRVSIFAESLSLIHHIFSNNASSCCIWVMKDYGVAESWTKQFTIDLGGQWGGVVGFRGNGDVLLASRSQDLVSFVDKYQDLVSYDPKSKQSNNFRIHGSAFYVDTYMESLVLLESVNGVLGRHQNFGIKKRMKLRRTMNLKGKGLKYVVARRGVTIPLSLRICSLHQLLYMMKSRRTKILKGKVRKYGVAKQGL